MIPAVALRRSAVVARAPIARAAAAGLHSSAVTRDEGRSEGSVASGAALGKRERADEERYARQREAESLAKLRKQLEESKKQLQDVSEALDKAEKSQKK